MNKKIGTIPAGNEGILINTLDIFEVNIEPDAVMVLSIPFIESPGVVEALNEFAERHGCRGMVLSKGATLETVTEEQMNAAGWYRGENETS